MKVKIDINNENEERVEIYAKARTSLISEIETLCINDSDELNGIKNDEIIKLHLSDILCFVSENSKVFAITEDDKYQVNRRLYQLEELYNDSIIKINQSCLVNPKKIKKFKSSIGGSLLIELIGGYSEYVSRRELKNVKRKMGL